MTYTKSPSYSKARVTLSFSHIINSGTPFSDINYVIYALQVATRWQVVTKYLTSGNKSVLICINTDLQIEEAAMKSYVIHSESIKGMHQCSPSLGLQTSRS
jgi:hypothetical protein